jgi:hypothetical protein
VKKIPKASFRRVGSEKQYTLFYGLNKAATNLFFVSYGYDINEDGEMLECFHNEAGEVVYFVAGEGEVSGNAVLFNTRKEEGEFLSMLDINDSLAVKHTQLIALVKYIPVMITDADRAFRVGIARNNYLNRVKNWTLTMTDENGVEFVVSPNHCMRKHIL